jgi:hypothetical protein
VNARRGAALAALLVLPLALRAQRLPSDDRKPPLTRKENWGMSLGIDVISAGFRPTRCPTVQTFPDGSQRLVQGSCSGIEHAYSSRGFGVGLNVGLVFLRHILFGGEVWTVGFSGTRDFVAESPPSAYHAETTNSLAASAYVGVLSSPLGNRDRVGRKVWLGLLAGKSHWSGQRKMNSLDTSICEMDDCRYEPLKMGRPGFLEPFVMFGGGDKSGGGGLRLAYRHHFGGFEAMHETVTFGLFFAFGRL